MLEKLEQPIYPADASTQSEKIEAAFAQKTSEHLKNWDERTKSIKDIPEQQFVEEESIIFNLEKLRSLFIDHIPPSKQIGEQHATYGDDTESLKTWGEFIGYIERAIGQNRQFNILVTGLPISGKATLRRAIANGLQVKHPNQVSSIDRDYIKLPQNFMLQQGINVVEDMHGLDPGSLNYKDLEMYNMVLYLQPAEGQHLKMITERVKVWQESPSRKVDLTDSKSSPDDNQLVRFIKSTEKQARAYSSRDRFMPDDIAVLENLHRRIPVIEVNPAEVIDFTYQK
jgi:hypothetical protein